MPRKPEPPLSLGRPGVGVKIASDLQLKFDGNALREEREQRGLRKRTVALALPADQTQLQRWEEGKFSPSAENLMKLSLLLGINPYRLFETNLKSVDIGTIHQGEARASLAELTRRDVGKLDAELLLLLHWLADEDKQKLLERALVMAEQRNPDVPRARLLDFARFLTTREADEEFLEEEPKLGRERLAEGLASGAVQGEAVRKGRQRRQGRRPEHPAPTERIPSEKPDPRGK